MPLKFLESPNDKKRFDQEIGELLAHAGDILSAEFAYILLFEAGDRDPIYSSPRFDELDGARRAIFCGFARQVIAPDGSGEVASDCLLVTPVSTAAGELSFLGARIIPREGGVLGALVIARSSLQDFAEAERRNLKFMTDSAAAFVQLKQTIFDLRQAGDSERRTIRNLQETERKFSALARNVPGAIFRYIREPGGPDKIEYMSPGCVDVWGFTAEELEGDPRLLWSIILPEDAAAMRASAQQSYDDLTPWQHRWRIKSKSGFVKWLQAYGTPYRTESGGVSWNTLILDVTVEQNAQMALAENTRLLHEAQKVESIGRLAGGVAHDFNNLLAVILGNSEAIDQARLHHDDKESLAEIIEASQRGAALVKQLLSFARKSDLRATVANTQQVLIAVERLLRRVLPANISLEVVQQAGLWPVQIDKSMFESALLNIVINARDAMPDGGAITIETSNVRIDHDYLLSREEDTRPGRYVMVAVTDTGTGIDEAVLPFVFEPFFSTKGPSDGTGLGLAMVEGFVKQSGGIVRVYSEPGRGTSLKMYFPAVDEASQSGMTSHEAPAIYAKGDATILLVEDQEPVRHIVQKTIVAAGYKVLTASSGDEAIEIYQRMHDSIDMIVTDVVMPGRIQGPQFVRLARKINANLPVLYMSGYPHEANVHGNGIRAEDISLMKPIRRNDLLTALSKLRSQR